MTRSPQSRWRIDLQASGDFASRIFSGGNIAVTKSKSVTRLPRPRHRMSRVAARVPRQPHTIRAYRSTKEYTSSSEASKVHVTLTALSKSANIPYAVVFGPGSVPMIVKSPSTSLVNVIKDEVPRT